MYKQILHVLNLLYIIQYIPQVMILYGDQLLMRTLSLRVHDALMLKLLRRRSQKYFFLNDYVKNGLVYLYLNDASKTLYGIRMWYEQEILVLLHYNDVIMSSIASQITRVSSCRSNVGSGSDHKKTSKLRVTGLCAGNSPGNYAKLLARCCHVHRSSRLIIVCGCSGRTFLHWAPGIPERNKGEGDNGPRAVIQALWLVYEKLLIDK